MQMLRLRKRRFVTIRNWSLLLFSAVYDEF
jgi:hypothetical protein